MKRIPHTKNPVMDTFWLSADGNLRTHIYYITYPGHELSVIKLELTHNDPVGALQGIESELIK